MAEENIPEEWRPIPGFPHEVSNLGRIRRSEPGHATFVGRILAPKPDNYGYLVVNLRVNGFRHRFGIHALVCAAFHGPRPTPEHEAAHWDGSRTNNVATNLRWATPKENKDDCFRHGRVPLGSNHFNVVLTEELVLKMKRFFREGLTAKQVSDLLGTNHRTTWDVKAGKTWRWLKDSDIQDKPHEGA